MIRLINQFYFAVCFWCFYLIAHLLRLVALTLPLRKKTSTNRPLKVLYLAAFFEENAGYHYRVAEWKKRLEADRHFVKVVTVFRSQAHFNNYLNTPHRFLIRGMRMRLAHLLISFRYDRVVVRRSILLYNEYGNLFMEKLLLQIHPNAILDLDDDMQRADAERAAGWYGKWLLEKRNKFTLTLGTYRKFIVGSPYLKQKVLSINKNCSANDVLIVPTCVNYAEEEPPVKYTHLASPLVIGWIGSNGNQHYLSDVIEGLNNLHLKHPLELLIVSGKPYHHPEAKFPIQNASWSLKSERELLRKMTIGIMPLRDSEMERGKCGFKLIQYMGMGIVSIASAVGVNNNIIKHGKNGFLVDKNSAWEEVFDEAIAAAAKYQAIGEAARHTIAEKYSFKAHRSAYLHFIQTYSSE